MSTHSLDKKLLALPEAEFSRKVDWAFKHYNSLLSLSQSLLAGSSLITPALILNGGISTPDDRGRALRVTLRWAVGHLAPAPPNYPLGTFRPFDDPTWQDPLWWSYNILRFRYLDPFRTSALEDLNVHTLTDVLINLTGIPDRDKFYSEHKRAIREVSAILREQLREHRGDEELRQMAVEELFLPLEVRARGRDVLALAATFRETFPRALLLEMAAQERLSGIEAVLSDLVTNRLLLVSEDGTGLLVPTALQKYVHARQFEADLIRRHRYAARHYLAQGRPIRAAWHLQQGGQAIEAVDLLLEVAEDLSAELRIQELQEVLSEFTLTQLPPDRWSKVQALLSDLYRKTGERDLALAACRRALRVTTAPSEQARLYHKLGKLYEDHDYQRASLYYQQADERFPSDDPARADLLKDRAWLHIHLQEWEKAESLLEESLTVTKAHVESSESLDVRRQQADIYDAQASLYRRRGQFENAIHFAQLSLVLREELGDLMRVADSCHNLALIYAEMGKPELAIAAHQEAMDTYRDLGREGNREAIAVTQLNIGGALYLAHRLEEAIEYYTASLETCLEIDQPRVAAKAYYNLAEAMADMDRVEEAQRHWIEGYRLSQKAHLDDQLQWFVKLRDANPALQDLTLPSQETSESPEVWLTGYEELLPEEQAAIEIAYRKGRVTTQTLMKATGISRASATRRLIGLVERKILVKLGRGRATNYILVK